MKGKTISKTSKSKTPVTYTAELTDDELDAAVEAYENSEGRAARKSKPESRAAQLTKLFYETAEGKELRQTAGSILNKLDPEDTVSIKIDVPKEFVRLTDLPRTEAGSRDSYQAATGRQGFKPNHA